MSSKMYRTALGKQVDMGSLLLKNEDVRAVGNMGVNARGDVINKKNDSIIPKAKQVNQEYRKQIRNQIEDVPIGTNKVSEVDDIEIEGFDTPLEVQESIEESPQTESATNKKPTKPKKGGLASAIAKAREVEQKKIETPREKSRGKKGVKKI
jgi:hypothetical protein